MFTLHLFRDYRPTVDAMSGGNGGRHEGMNYKLCPPDPLRLLERTCSVGLLRDFVE